MKTAKLLITLCFVLGLMSGSAMAGTISYSCPDATKCSGNEYGVYIAKTGTDTYLMEYGILLKSSYTGDLATDYINSVAIKNFAPSFTDLTLTGGPTGTGLGDWNLILRSELDAGGCKDPSNANGGCVSAVLNAGAGLKLPSVITDPIELVWTFTFRAPSVYETAHLKYFFTDGTYDARKEEYKKAKNTGLGSFDIGIRRPPEELVPEPASLVLIGTGLLALVALSSRRRK